VCAYKHKWLQFYLLTKNIIVAEYTKYNHRPLISSLSPYMASGDCFDTSSAYIYRNNYTSMSENNCFYNQYLDITQGEHNC